jgi:DNA mismatch endonuclease (patch repair protein)
MDALGDDLTMRERETDPNWTNGRPTWHILLGDMVGTAFTPGVFKDLQGAELVSVAAKAPSFKGLSPASETSSRVKRANRRHDTSPELLLRRELWKMGLRYRKNVEALPGKPDIVFVGTKVAVFCDGDFWHGRDWPTRRVKLEQGTNATYWLAKIARNIERDLSSVALLERDGWRVMRLWETDIKRDPHAAACCVRDLVLACHGAAGEPRDDDRPASVGEHEVR